MSKTAQPPGSAPAPNPIKPRQWGKGSMVRAGGAWLWFYQNTKPPPILSPNGTENLPLPRLKHSLGHK